MFNKRDPLWLVPIAFVVTGVACWMLLRDVFPGTIFRKPVCASTAPSTGDCVPQRLLDKLPPHPGRSGTDTLAGVDADGDGVRDGWRYSNGAQNHADFLKDQVDSSQEIVLLPVPPVANVTSSSRITCGARRTMMRPV